MNTPKTMQKTIYRSNSDGYCKWLQYKRTFSIFGINLFSYWSNIKCPYYDKLRGRSLDTMGWETLICSYNTNFKSFIEQYPNIEMYKPVFNQRQNELEDKAAKYHEDLKNNQGTEILS